MKYLFIATSILALTACGTITTLSNSDEGISSHLKKRGTYCDSLLRVYSGVSYDLCSLHANPNLSAVYLDGFVGFYLSDIVLSAISDTVVLPYSIYAQSKYNNIEIHGRQ